MRNTSSGQPSEHGTRGSIVAALEALGVGDINHATQLLLSALEDGSTAHAYRCRRCTQTFEWPGLRSHHELLVHGDDHGWGQLTEAT
jgi:hypothetical protein